jgi:pyridoxal/pyridoxine/pyridoxamine kinase
MNVKVWKIHIVKLKILTKIIFQNHLKSIIKNSLRRVKFPTTMRNIVIAAVKSTEGDGDFFSMLIIASIFGNMPSRAATKGPLAAVKEAMTMAPNVESMTMNEIALSRL